jgi:predicted  nucleic acid-binding Zn-ribbon protein
VGKLKEKIIVLIQLQDCDNRIQQILNKKNQGPLKIERLEHELEMAESKFREDQDRLGTLKKDRRTVEQEIQDLETMVEKSHVKLSSIKSNKEYQAALKEIEELKRVKFETEDRVIQVMEEIEGLEETCVENQKKQLELRKRYERDKKDILQELVKIDKELKGLEKEKGHLTETIDKELLERYLFLRDRKGGQAISPVIGGVCQTCHMGIPPQRFNESIRGHSLLTCPNCNRIIYWGEDEHFKKSLKKV